MFSRLLITASSYFIASVNAVSRLLGRNVVADISTEELRQLQSESEPNHEKQTAFILVDVRSESEWSVSMIPGAITRTQFEAKREKYRNHTVIPYCTVGGRSYFYARGLLRKGMRTRNYQGSILGWCHSSLPLVDPDGNPTKRVHVYSRALSVPAEFEAVTGQD